MAKHLPLPLKKINYIKAFTRSSVDVIKWKLFKTKKDLREFLSYKNITLNYSNDVLKNVITANKPFAAVRIGATEMGCLNNFEKIQLGFTKTYKPSVRFSMKNNGGFFPTTDKNLTYFAKHFIKEAHKSDILGISGIHMEAYMFQRYFKNADVIQYEAFEPLRGDWIQALAGKKVLVVSPFDEEIKEQFKRLDQLFPPHVVPSFKLMTVKAVQTIADAVDDRYDSWFDALDSMKVDIMKHDFDIALVGAGAYGSHLCWFIKTMGKQAIQTGGATPTLFGIIGKRWENRHHVIQYKNEFWIRPKEKPPGAEKVEHGAYW